MIFDSKELIRHVKADEMAAIYADVIPRIFEAITEIRKQSARLREAFTGAGRSWSFDLKIESRDGCSEEESIRREFKRDAWSALIDKLGVKKYMATVKGDQLEEILTDSCRYRDRSGIDNFPDITPENMLAVLSAYVCNIDEFLIESVKEEFE